MFLTYSCKRRTVNHSVCFLQEFRKWIKLSKNSLMVNMCLREMKSRNSLIKELPTQKTKIDNAFTVKRNQNQSVKRMFESDSSSNAISKNARSPI